MTMTRTSGARCPVREAFSLVELLVAVGIVALLIAILMPSLTVARASASRSACLSNLRQVGVAIHCYAHDNRGRIPFGPKAPPMLTATNFYPATGTPTSLISLSNGSPVGAGLLLRKHLARQPRVLFCPGADQPVEADAELNKVGRQQAQCSYYYRHGSIARQFDDPAATEPTSDYIRIAGLGRNRDGRPIRALVIDTQFPAPSGFAGFGIFSRTHHQAKWANVFYADGHALPRLNGDRRFTVDLADYDALRNAFDRILKVFETADRE
ncbi:MAG: type II secretion system protein [Phycisphaerae bacterium]